MPLPLLELFPDVDYRFHLTLRRGELAPFFVSAEPDAMAERARWLREDAARYAVGTPDVTTMVAEFEGMVADWKKGAATSSESSPLRDRLVALGDSVEPDFLLLAKDSQGALRLRGGVVCFPSSWSLPEKIGLTLEEIHGVVPGLNAALGPPISQFLGRLKPGIAYERANWGLAATPELNMHPALKRPRLTLPLDLGRIWVRIEDQILAALPETGGILFGIRLRVLPLHELLDDPALKRGFHRALATLPEALAAYKGIAEIRETLLADKCWREAE